MRCGRLRCASTSAPGGPVAVVVARPLKIPRGMLGMGAERGDLVVLNSESLGDEARSRRLLGRGRRARFRALAEKARLGGTVPSCGRSAGIRFSFDRSGRRGQCTRRPAHWRWWLFAKRASTSVQKVWIRKECAARAARRRRGVAATAVVPMSAAISQRRTLKELKASVA